MIFTGRISALLTLDLALLSLSPHRPISSLDSLSVLDGIIRVSLKDALLVVEVSNMPSTQTHMRFFSAYLKSFHAQSPSLACHLRSCSWYSQAKREEPRLLITHSLSLLLSLMIRTDTTVCQARPRNLSPLQQHQAMVILIISPLPRPSLRYSR